MTQPNRVTPRRALALGLATLVAAAALITVPVAANADPIGSVSGVVTSQGAPLTGAFVSLASDTGLNWYNTAADSSGVFTFAGVETGTYTLSANAIGTFLPVPSVTVTISAATPSLTHDFEFVPVPRGTGTISGTVVDSVSGLPVSGGSYSVRSGDLFYGGDAIGSAGEYSITDLPTGTFTVTFLATGHAFAEETFVLADGESSVRNVSVLLANSFIVGTVVDNLGNPALINQQVSLTREGVDTGLAGFVNSDGEYSASFLTAGTYTVTAGGTFTQWEKQSKTVTVGENATATLNFVLAPRKTSSIIGYVLNDEGGSVQNICVDAIKISSGKVLGSDVTTLEGTYLIENLKPGDYRLRFTDCDNARHPKYAKAFWADAKKRRDATVLTLVAGEDQLLNQMTVSLKGNH